MATESDPTGLTFQDVDWEQVQEDQIFTTGRNTLLQALTFLLIGVGIVWDYLVIENTSPTIQITNIPGLTWMKWDVLSVEWLFLITLAVMVFNMFLPLYQNKRLTAYYWRQYKKNKMAVFGLVFLGAMFFVGIVGPIVMKEPQVSIDTLRNAYRPPVYMTASPQAETLTGTWKHPLGTDAKGLDMIKLLVFGMRVSLEVGLISTALTVAIGTLVGATAAHMGGMVDEVLMRYVDLQATFPTFILLVYLIFLYGGSLFLIIMLYGFFSWEGTARLIRSEALQRTEESYVQASEAAGASQAWIIRRHIIPNVSSTVITNATLLIPSFILGEAALSFLGFADDSIHSWGQVISAGRTDLATAPWIATVPGVALFITVLAMNYVGDAINDAVDPRRSQE
jgi:peptide/nickel transport system permease protein